MKILWKKLSDSKPDTYQENSPELSFDELKWQIALENSNVGVWDWNSHSDEVFYSSESKKILGYEAHELSTSTMEWNKRVHPDDRTTYFRNLKSHVKGECDTFRNEHRVICKDGTYKWVLINGKTVDKDSHGKPSRIIGTHTDITYQKKYDGQSKKQLQLITSQNERLHNFTHIVSHNLKTHIGNFKNILEFYDEANSENEKIELVNHLKTISEALTTTIVDLDDIISIKAKSNAHELNERINVFSCAEKIIDSLQIEIDKNQIGVYNSIRKDDHLLANRPYLESIFYNLICNSIKYRSNDRKSKVILQSIHSKKELKILISDNGIGIDTEKHKNQLFEMYQTFHGTDRLDSRGVGLYITKIQVEAIGGTINVESKPDEGTTFILTFKKQ